MGAEHLPVIAFTATTQPGEPSAWAILAMARAAATDPQMRAFSQWCKLVFLPMTNPDGVVHGYANTCPRGKMIFLEFDALAENSEVSPETKAIWDYLTSPPSFRE